MDGLKKIFLRIIPIIMLICFICYGITIAFNVENLTYLTKIEENGNTMYYFDFPLYVNNLDIKILTRAINNVIDIQTLTNVLNSFKEIWKNGYQLWDVSKSIANGIILVIDTILTIINIILTPLRIASGLLLTAMSLMGININENHAIINVLNKILDNGNIPLIQQINVQ